MLIFCQLYLLYIFPAFIAEGDEFIDIFAVWVNQPCHNHNTQIRHFDFSVAANIYGADQGNVYGHDDMLFV